MNPTEQTLLEQMRITEFDIAHRKELLLLNEDDFSRLASYRPNIEPHIDALVDKFYEMQTGITEIALLIGDADTLTRLRTAQRRYILDLFSGLYDLEYVNNRLRIGLVHKRIGVEPKLYLAAINTLKGLLIEDIFTQIEHEQDRIAMLTALDKLFLFDITLVFETYIRSLVSEIESSKEKSEIYARTLEEKVRERTQQLEEMSRTDSLTGLLSVRHLQENLTRTLRTCQRRAEPVVIAYLDINDFKQINDTQGHQRGDEILRIVGDCIRKVSRAEDYCFRYGGDEFCLILPNCNEDQARNVYLQRLTNALKEQVDDVTLSIGMVQTGPMQFDEGHSLIRLADERMYAAKRAMKQVNQKETH
ncbi:MAG: protoglobin domain-containing protein [Aeromonas popoffii]|jgi:diguanylate cyclase (GGDEF)-like protein|uniref:Diguanylate cyclase DosC n=1 Tax=Aeromonas popoffii TaxID=70856 RepID=A0ABS5GN82_9GAMM|nr:MULTISPECIES: protoglobin domain-containing protein [Aeromonas]MBR7628597.1 diguanylate cyclase [Aeromonas popoffii]MDF2412711.1 diguanylate cyclase [Aeromonas sp. 1HA1]PTT50794.1 GGDEF domain-containing protein [Aeromonas sp. HMWF014]